MDLPGRDKTDKLRCTVEDFVSMHGREGGRGGREEGGRREGGRREGGRGGRDRRREGGMEGRREEHTYPGDPHWGDIDV